MIQLTLLIPVTIIILSVLVIGYLILKMDTDNRIKEKQTVEGQILTHVPKSNLES